MFRGADVNSRTSNGMTPIMAAVSKGHFKSAQSLAKLGANLKLTDKSDQSIIHLAAKKDKHQVIEKLLQTEEWLSKIDENDLYDNTPLHLACSQGHMKSVEVLLNLGASIENKNEDERTPFLLAAKKGHNEVVEFLLKRFENKDNLKNKSDGDSNPASPLAPSRTQIRTNLVNDSDEDENSALHLAASKSMTNTVEVLLKFKADVRKRNMKGWTPLESAAAAGSYKCVLRLLDAGAEVNPISKGDDTPLHLAAMKGHTIVTKLLLERGAKVSSKNKDKKNALDLAIQYSNISVAKVILDSKQWRDAMTSSSRRANGLPTTPMRMLIRKFPSLATQVLDKCITPVEMDSKNTNNEDEDDEMLKAKPENSENKDDHEEDGSKEDTKEQIDVEALADRNKKPAPTENQKYNFDFTFLEDSYLKDMYNKENFGLEERIDHHKKLQELDLDEGYTRDSLYNSKNHPLMIMSRHQQILLKHPLCLALLSHKWSRFKKIFWFYNLFYLLYLGLITTYVLMGQNLLAGSQETMNNIRWTTMGFIAFGLLIDIYDAFKVNLNKQDKVF